MSELEPTSPGTRPIAVVADDDGATRRVLKVLLERAGYRVLIAVDGAGAIHLIRDTRPAVIFLDARMPAPDGYEVSFHPVGVLHETSGRTSSCSPRPGAMTTVSWLRRPESTSFSPSRSAPHAFRPDCMHCRNVSRRPRSWPIVMRIRLDPREHER